MGKKLLCAVLAALMILPLGACSAEEPVMPVNTASHSELQRPEIGENFYGYVNYDYLINGQIPYDEMSIGTFDTIRIELESDVSDIIDELAKKDSSDPFEKALSEMYSQYLDTDARDEAGIEALLPAIGMIEDCKTTDDLVKTMGALFEMYGVGAFFCFTAEPDFYNTDVYNLTLSHFNTCGNMKENFTKTSNGPENMGEQMEEVLKALEVDQKEAKQRAKNVVSMIKEIMVASMDSDIEYSHYVDDHYNSCSRKDLEKLLSNVDVDTLYGSFGVTGDKVIVYDVPQTQKINELFTEKNLREIKDYMLLCMMFEYSNYLPPSMMKSFSSLKNTDKELDKNAKKAVSTLLENELGVVYGRRICTKQVKSSAENMLSDIRNSCRELIRNCDRLSSEGKKKLITKLDSIIFLIGYDKDHTMPFEITSAKEGGSFLGNIAAVKSGNAVSKLSVLGQKVNRSEWEMSSVTVNAQYDPFLNTVVIPAAMLSKASYDPELGEYTNLGRLGYVIAHELNHAFDSNGVNYDEVGRYNRDWLTKEDREAYNVLQEKAADYYTDYKILDVYSIDGAVTLSENLADLGAVQCLANIAKNKEQLRQFFEGVAVQCSTLCTVEDAVEGLVQDIHSPAEARANAVLSSTDRFYEAYDIGETDKMYVAPENRIKVW